MSEKNKAKSLLNRRIVNKKRFLSIYIPMLGLAILLGVYAWQTIQQGYFALAIALLIVGLLFVTTQSITAYLNNLNREKLEHIYNLKVAFKSSRDKKISNYRKISTFFYIVSMFSFLIIIVPSLNLIGMIMLLFGFSISSLFDIILLRDLLKQDMIINTSRIEDVDQQLDETEVDYTDERVDNVRKLMS